MTDANTSALIDSILAELSPATLDDNWVSKYPQTNPVLAQSPANINPIIMDGLSID